MIRSLVIADELKKRGNEILFTTTKVRKSFINKAGYEVFGEGHSEVNLNDEKDQSINYFRNNRRIFIDWLFDELDAAAKFKPDIVVNSPSFFGPLIKHRYGVPYVTVLNAQWLSHFRGLLGIGKARDIFSHSILRRILKPIFRHQFEKIYLEEIRNFYKILNVPNAPNTQIDLHAFNPVLIPSIREFEPIQPDERDDVHFIGPLFWKGFENLSFDMNKLFGDPRKPLIYVGLGGSIFRQDVYRKMIDLFQSNKQWNVIMSIGPNFERNTFPKDTDNFVLKQYVPGLKVAEQSKVVVNTASHGTVMQALWHGKPLVVIPHNIDQGTIAARISELGLGINLNAVSILDFSKREKYFLKAVQVNPKKIVNSVKIVLSSPEFSRRAEAISKYFRKYHNSAEIAADYIELYAKRLKR